MYSAQSDIVLPSQLCGRSVAAHSFLVMTRRVQPCLQLLLACSQISLLAAAGCVAHHSKLAATPTSTEPTEKGVFMPPPTPRMSEVAPAATSDVKDPYVWLEDISRSDTQDWVAKQDRHSRQSLGSVPGRSQVEDSLKELLYVDEWSTPTTRSNRVFFAMKRSNEEKAVYYWRNRNSSETKVLLDPHDLSTDGSVGIEGIFPSWDGSLVAYTVSVNTQDYTTIKVIATETGKLLSRDVIPGVRWPRPTWAPDNSGFYYTSFVREELLRPGDMPQQIIRYHRIGTECTDDPVIFGQDVTKLPEKRAHVSEDGLFLLVTASVGPAQNELFIKRLHEPSSPFTRIACAKDALYYAATYGPMLYIMTNEGAPRYRIFAVDSRRPQRSDWKEIVPEDENAVLRQFEIVGKHLVLRRVRNANSEIRIHRLDGTFVRVVDLPGIGTAQGVSGSTSSEVAYFTYESFNQRKTVYSLSITTGRIAEAFTERRTPLAVSSIVVKQAFVESSDGTRVPVFIAHRKGLNKNGITPTVLSGYGAWGLVWDPYYSPRLQHWMELGGIVAFACVRGGGEFGEGWHAAGMLERKQNSIDDFIAVAEWLIRERYTAPARLGIWGGSFGGILVGAAMVQRADLFGAAVLVVPVLDMLRYHLTADGPYWVPEFGDPRKPAEAKWLRLYSPYHNVRRGESYPSLLIISADSDDRVDPMHARKFAAVMQWAQSEAESPRPVLLSIQKQAGHHGADLRKSEVVTLADQIVFLASKLGLALGHKR